MGTNEGDAEPIHFIVRLILGSKVIKIAIKSRRDGSFALSEFLAPNEWKSILNAGELGGILNQELSKLSGIVSYSIKFKDGAVGSLVLESVLPRCKIVIFGAGHVGKAVARIGRIVGYDITLIDDRHEFLWGSEIEDIVVICSGEKFPDASFLKPLVLDKRMAFVIVTRGHQYDEACLKMILDEGVSSCKSYVGMIGSQRRIRMIKKRLESAGYDKEVIDNIYAPIGLEIGAVSPEEIAVAIMAEIIGHFRGKQ